ncbi:MAG: hypothetical protein ACTSQY_00395 [Candidatus Odinarchaeia archaeon]|nr:MAG: hypothetical protein [Lokiarchaeota virus Fenrir Meg22_1012]URC17260.1 MAG: hypothetical protein [Lokiarchaeota virus Fenrir Meg22_1214]
MIEKTMKIFLKLKVISTIVLDETKKLASALLEKSKKIVPFLVEKISNFVFDVKVYFGALKTEYQRIFKQYVEDLKKKLEEELKEAI